MIKITLVCLLFVIGLVLAYNSIPDNEDYGPIRRPQNPTAARDILGYDNFQTHHQQQGKSESSSSYGNNWEQYDTNPSYHLDNQRNYQPNNYRYNY